MLEGSIGLWNYFVLIKVLVTQIHNCQNSLNSIPFILCKFYLSFFKMACTERKITSWLVCVFPVAHTMKPKCREGHRGNQELTEASQPPSLTPARAVFQTHRTVLSSHRVCSLCRMASHIHHFSDSSRWAQSKLLKATVLVLI
jgi:hypothetical protein